MRQQESVQHLGLVASLDLLPALETGGCPACHVQQGYFRRHVKWFLIENYSSPPTLKRLLASNGFCRDHFAAIVARTQPGETWQMSFVTEVLIDYQRILVRRALAALGNSWKRFDSPRRNVWKPFVPRSGCPLCEDSRDWREWATSGLVDLWEHAELSDRLSGSMICLPDLAQAWRDSGGATRILIQRRAMEDIARLPTALTDGHDVTTLKSFLCGDAPVSGAGTPLASELVGRPRARRRPQAKGGTAGPTAGPDVGAPVLECLQASVCPVCRRLETSDAGFFASGKAAKSPELLCRAHLARLLEQAEPALASTVAHRLAEDLAAAFGSNGAGPDRTANCPACSHASATTLAAAASVVAVLKTEPGVTSFASTGVICARHLPHVLRWAGRAEGITILQRYDTVLRRLAYLLAEYQRKRDYRYKHEPKGEEQEAWRQAIVLLAGNRP
jgi:hypothetical protein